MAQQSNLLNQTERLKRMIHDWIPKRKASVDTLRALAEKLIIHHNKVCKAKLAGSSAGIAGFVLATGGFGLSFVTFGTSLIISGLGLGVGALGGVTNAGSSIAESCIQKDTYDTAQKIINEDREVTEAIEKLLKEIGKETLKSKIKNGVLSGAIGAFIVKNCVETGLRIGARAATTAVSEGGEALMRGLSVTGKVAHVGGFVFSAVFLPVDIYTLVTSSMDIDASRKGKKNRDPKAVKKLRELADELEKNMPSAGDFSRELDNFISNVTSDSI